MTRSKLVEAEAMKLMNLNQIYLPYLSPIKQIVLPIILRIGLELNYEGLEPAFNKLVNNFQEQKTYKNLKN